MTSIRVPFSANPFWAKKRFVWRRKRKASPFLGTAQGRPVEAQAGARLGCPIKAIAQITGNDAVGLGDDPEEVKQASGIGQGAKGARTGP